MFIYLYFILTWILTLGVTLGATVHSVTVVHLQLKTATCVNVRLKNTHIQTMNLKISKTINGITQVTTAASKLPNKNKIKNKKTPLFYYGSNNGCFLSTFTHHWWQYCAWVAERIRIEVNVALWFSTETLLQLSLEDVQLSFLLRLKISLPQL